MKRNEFLLHAIGEVDADLVERAAKAPVTKMHLMRRLVAVAAALVMLVGAGVWIGLNRGQSQPPMESDGAATQSTTPSTTSPSGGDGGGVGGDSNSCVVHSLLYHSFDPSVCRLVMTDEEFNAYMDTLPEGTEPDRTYPRQDCNYPESNIVDFIRKFGITREQYIQARGYDKFIEKMGEEAFLNHRYVWGDPTEDEVTWELFTYGEYLDAIFGDDPLLTQWVFTYYMSTTVENQEYYDLEWQGQYYYIPHHYPYDEPLVTYLRELPQWEDRDPYQLYNSFVTAEMRNITDFMTFCDIDRETYISIYGWEDKLDEKAMEHYKNAPYTYRQYVEAVFGDDDTLRRWVFGQYVFHPDYPTLEEFATLTEADRFYTPTLMSDETIKPYEPCVLHSNYYHDFYSRFPSAMVQEFKAVVKDYEERNIVTFVEYFNLSRSEFMEYLGFFESEEEEMEIIAMNHGVGCPYTYRQFVDAIYGDDPYLTAWVFANESTWPQADPEEWEKGYLWADEWPPEDYRYTRDVYYDPADNVPVESDATTDSTTTAQPWSSAGRDEFGNTTTRTQP